MAIAVAIAVSPSYARWETIVADGQHARSIMLVGYDESDDQRQIGVVCTVAAGQLVTPPSLVVSLPTPRQFIVRPGDAAQVEMSAMGWVVGGKVGTNDSSAFAVSALEAGLTFVEELSSSADEIEVRVSAGPINELVKPGRAGMEPALIEFKAACEG